MLINIRNNLNLIIPCMWFRMNDHIWLSKPGKETQVICIALCEPASTDLISSLVTFLNKLGNHWADMTLYWLDKGTGHRGGGGVLASEPGHREGGSVSFWTRAQRGGSVSFWTRAQRGGSVSFWTCLRAISDDRVDLFPICAWSFIYFSSHSPRWHINPFIYLYMYLQIKKKL